MTFLLALCAGAGLLAVGYLLGQMFPLKERVVTVPRQELFSPLERHIINQPPRPNA